MILISLTIDCLWVSPKVINALNEFLHNGAMPPREHNYITYSITLPKMVRL